MSAYHGPKGNPGITPKPNQKTNLNTKPEDQPEDQFRTGAVL
jgi:hypothetical protein